MSGNQSTEYHLQDGRAVRLDSKGNFRDAITGRFVSKSDVQGMQVKAQENAEEQSRQAVVAAVSQRGFPAGSPEEAWGQIVGVQAEIALEAGSGTKATQAAKLVAQATGMLDNPEEEAIPWAEIVLGKALSIQVLALVNTEMNTRGNINETARMDQRTAG